MLATAWLGVVPSPEAAGAQTPPPRFDFQREVKGRQDMDARRGVVAPTSQQRRGAPTGVTVRWNRFGTPQTVTASGRFLAEGLAEGLAADPVAAARQWLTDNQALFGLTAEQVAERRRTGATGQDAVARSPRLAAVLDAIGKGEFSPDEPERFHSLVDAVLVPDHFMVAADFDAYWQAQREVDWLWREPAAWWKASTLNTARMGFFSSDRTIREYAGEIWGMRGF